MNDELRRLLDTSFRLNDNPALRAMQERAEEMNRLMEPFRERAEAMDRLMEPFRERAEAMDRMMAPFRERTEEFHRALESIKIPALDRLTASSELMRKELESAGVFSMATDATRLLDQFKQPAIPAFDPESIRASLYVPEIPEAPAEVSPAVETLQRIQSRFDAERAEKQDRRHSVYMLVTLADGSRLFMHNMSNDGDNLIRIRGVDMTTSEERDVTVGPHAFQFEFVTVENPPPDLRIVE